MSTRRPQARARDRRGAARGRRRSRPRATAARRPLRDGLAVGARRRGPRGRRGRGQRAARAGRGGRPACGRSRPAPCASAATRSGRATRAPRSRPASRTSPRTGCTPGVAPSLSIASNIVLKSYRDATPPGRSSVSARIRDRAVELIQPLRREGARARDAGPPALGRQPAEGRARPRVLERAARARGRRADARARRRRDRDRPRLPPRGRSATASRCC